MEYINGVYTPDNYYLANKLSLLILFTNKVYTQRSLLYTYYLQIKYTHGEFYK